MRIGSYCLGLVSLAVSSFGCAGDSKPGPPGNEGGTGPIGEQTVEIFSWWTQPGEAEALQALVDLNRQRHPNVRIFNAAAQSGEDSRARLAERLDDGDPPDLFQMNAHDLPAFVATNAGALEPLNDLFEREDLHQAVLPDILSNVSRDGSAYAMPVNIHRENTLFYNKVIFEQHGLTPPSTVAEFLELCDALKAAGVTPVAVSHQGWILRILFNSLAMGSMGADAFAAFMTGEPADASLGAAIDVFENVLTNYSNDDQARADPDFGWTQAAEAVFNGEAAMFFHGDWAKGYYVQLGWEPGVDFGVVGAPGASDVFWYGVDIFALPAGARNKTGAEGFLATVGSTAGQIAFNVKKGSTPMRPDVPRSGLDSEGRTTLDDFQNASHRMMVVNKNIYDVTMSEFAESRDKEALFQMYVDNPPAD